MVVRRLSVDECDLLGTLDRSEKVRAAWMKTESGIRFLDFIYLDIDGYGPKLAECINTLKFVATNGGCVFGAFEGDQIVGMAAILTKQEQVDGTSQLISLDVSRAFRRQGIGRELLKNCLAESTERRCHRVLVQSNPHENTLRFFKSMGFVHSQNPQMNCGPDSPCFPQFEFPPPFGNNVEKKIDFELDATVYGKGQHFTDRTTISEIDRYNCYAMARLRVKDEQSFMFGSNPAYWMACSRYEFGENHKLLSINFDNFPVGVIGYGSDDNTRSAYIEPMMVDSMFQRRGIGSRALELFCKRLTVDGRFKKITIGNRSDNVAAGRTYEKAGFMVTGSKDLSCFREKYL